MSRAPLYADAFFGGYMGWDDILKWIDTAGVKWVQLGTLFAEAIGFALFMIFYAPRLVHHMRPGLRRMSSHSSLSHFAGLASSHN